MSNEGCSASATGVTAATMVLLAGWMAGLATTLSAYGQARPAPPSAPPSTSAPSVPAFPVRPVRFIIPFPPGGGADVVARVAGQRVSEHWGQQLVIDNRAGAGGNIGAELGAAAPADGYTLYQFNIANTIAVSLYKKLNYDPLKDFSAVSLMASSPFILVVHPSVKANTVQEFVALAKAQPGKLSYASSGNGGPSHISAEMLKSMTGIQLNHVPYKGISLILSDLLAGQVQLTFSVPGSVVPLIKTGRLRALGITTARRSAVVPDIPTIAESGVPGYELATWYAVVVPHGTAAPIIAKLNADFVRALQLPEVRERLTGAGFDVIGSTSPYLAQYIQSETAKWAKVVAFAHARID